MAWDAKCGVLLSNETSRPPPEIQILPEVLQLLSWATASAYLFYGSRLGYATDSAANMTDDGPNVPDSLIDHVEENEISHATICQPQSSYINGVGQESGGTNGSIG